MQFAVTADCHFPVQKMPCFTVRMNIQTKRLNSVKAGRVLVYRHYAGTHRDYTGIRPGRAAATPRFNRGKPGLHRERIQMFHTGCSRYSPGCSRCQAGRCRSYLVTPGSSRRY
ncbi:hypothetical protein DPMN_002441 [Dreissena polymorpha]|uniref:Uncharacterized protein n=1 Tax=Dreissena polymorpha TaxID=45954 RepID=A0A9D4MLZ8_DREPO|nr:hypothetical protein DPMN_002441 [Dreissena polymorpha]